MADEPKSRPDDEPEATIPRPLGRGASLLMKRNNIVIVIVSCLSLLLIAFLVYVFIGISQMKKVPSLSFKDALEYTTKDNKEALITVGIIKDGKTEYRVYGENGKEV